MPVTRTRQGRRAVPTVLRDAVRRRTAQLLPRCFVSARQLQRATGLSKRKAEDLYKGRGSLSSGETLVRLAETAGLNPAYLLLGRRGGPPVLGESAPAAHDAAADFLGRITADLRREGFDEELLGRALPTADWLYATQLDHARQTVKQHKEVEEQTKRQWKRRKTERHTTTHGPTVTVDMFRLIREEYGEEGT